MNSSGESLIKTEYADFSELIGSPTQIKLITLQQTTPPTSIEQVQQNLSALEGVNLNDSNEQTDKEHTDQTSASNSPTHLNLTSCYTSFNNCVSTHTFRKTEWDVKKLENYVRNAFCDSTPMENMVPAILNRYLKSFFELAKKSDGMDYEPESLIGFMNSFERYLKTKSYPESLLRSETFKEARNVLKKKRDLVRSIGKLIRTKTKDTCYLLQFHRNLLKEKGLLGRDNPDCLLAEIYLNNMIYFGEYLKEDKAWRGNLNLVWGDMVLERDPQNGLEYLTLATYGSKKANRHQQFQTGVVKINSRSKTQANNASKQLASSASGPIDTIITPVFNTPHSTSAPRIYSQRQPVNCCPVEAYKVYRSRRPNNCLDRDSPFYLAPLFKSKNQSKVWYKALAMSCQRLDALFYCLFKKAGVDLNSLANMSQQQQQLQQQQQQGNAIIGLLSTTPTSLSHWNSLIKQNQSDNEDDETTAALLQSQNGVVNGTSVVSNQFHQVVPVQIQVQVQVQVPITSAHQQQQLDSIIVTSVSNISAVASTTTTTPANISPNTLQQQAARLYLLSPNTAQSIGGTNGLGNGSFAIMET